MSVAERLDLVRREISDACVQAGRDSSEVRLLPVSKTHPVEVLKEGIAAGITQFGENRVQELDAKRSELADFDVKWSLIGPLQSNKAKKTAEIADEFQALSTEKVARILNRRLEELDKYLDVLIEVNTSGEDTKHGLVPSQTVDFAKLLTTFPRLRPRGLMTVALPGPDWDKVGECFETMRKLQTDLRREMPHIDWRELSMGMSGDFKLAILHGSTCVRIGTAIFGARNYGSK